MKENERVVELATLGDVMKRNTPPPTAPAVFPPGALAGRACSASERAAGVSARSTAINDDARAVLF